jgi:glycosyltransferase involved in cell wall biosynthesis
LAPVLARHDARFLAIGASLTPRVDGALEVLQWSEAHEIDLIRGLDVGVMPLPDTPWTRGKCGYKLIQYMACGLPVIASPVGVNSQIVDHGVNGFLAESEADWRDAADRLLNDPQLRKSMGDAGRRKIEQGYALAHWGQNLARLLKDIHRGRDWCRI